MGNYKNSCCKRDNSIMDVLRRLESTHKKTIVIEDEGELCGIVTDGDIRRYLLNSDDLTVSVEQIMTRNPIYLYEDQMDEAYECMNKHFIDAVPIIGRDGKLCNIVFRYDEFAREGERETTVDVPVVIMAGGKGTRLLPYTNILPKPLMPMNNKTVIESIMETFEICGCKKFWLVLNYKKEIIKAYFGEVNHPYTLEYVEEETFMGTGGGLSYLKDRIHTTFIVSNCDIVLNIDYAKAVAQHADEKNEITMIVAKQNYSIPYGTIQVDETGAVEELKEKPKLQFLVNTGVYILEPTVLERLQMQCCDMTDIIEDAISRGSRVGTYIIDEDDWMDVGEMRGLTNSLK